METQKSRYFYVVRENNLKETELIFEGDNLPEVRIKAMTLYRQLLLKAAKQIKLEWNKAYPVSVNLVEEINGEFEYYPIMGTELNKMEIGWEIESRIMQELNPMNAFFEKA